jgi:upstream activation factor subunit UAF30
MAPTKTTSVKTAPAAASSASDVKKTSATKAAATKSVVKPEVEPEVVEVVTPSVVDEEAVAKEETPVITQLINEYNAKTEEIKKLEKDRSELMKRIMKETSSLLKQKSKNSSKKNRAPRAPSGFAKQTVVSDELYDFFSIERGTLISRIEVIRKINEYIKKNNLQNPEDKRRIKPDASLQKILASTPADEVTYFNLQTFLSKHFTKA